MDVSVIIVNYNTMEITLNCINSIFEHTKDISFEVILVDNASTDGSRECFKSDNRIVFIENTMNMGFGNANNIGYTYASGDYLFFLNSDTLLLNNSIKLFYDKVKLYNIEVAGSVLLDSDCNPSFSYGDIYSFKQEVLLLFNKYLKRIGLDIMKNGNIENLRYPFEVDYIMGADLFVNRNVIEKVGLFDPQFFMYYEEYEFQYRIKLKGIQRYIIDGPRIIHLHGASSSKVKGEAMKRVNLQYSHYLFAKKHFSKLSYIVIRILYPLFNLPPFLLKYGIRSNIIYYKYSMLPLRKYPFYSIGKQLAEINTISPIKK